MSSLNKVQLIGRLGKNPEFKALTNGNKVASFSVATSEKWKDKNSGETKETTTWHNIVIWGSLADVAARYLKKGDNVYLEGKITTRSYEKDGVTRYVTEIVVNNMVMLGGKSQGGQGTQGEAAWDPNPGPTSGSVVASPANSASNNDPFGDLPF